MIIKLDKDLKKAEEKIETLEVQKASMALEIKTIEK
jgi:hypothetical protein